MAAQPRPAQSRNRITIPAMAFLVVVLVIHLVAQVTGPDLVAEITQPLLLPPLIVIVIAASHSPRPAGVRLLIAALIFSWGGDLAPRFMDDGFVVMLGFFLVAHLFYIGALWPMRANAVVVKNSNWAVPYIAAGIAIVLVCAQQAGGLLPAVIAYTIVIAVMAMLATALGFWGGFGAVLFMFSDALIALRAFTNLDFAGAGAVVMLTYVVAQVLLAGAILRWFARRAARR